MRDLSETLIDVHSSSVGHTEVLAMAKKELWDRQVNISFLKTSIIKTNFFLKENFYFFIIKKFKIFTTCPKFNSRCDFVSKQLELITLDMKDKIR